MPDGGLRNNAISCRPKIRRKTDHGRMQTRATCSSPSNSEQFKPITILYNYLLYVFLLIVTRTDTPSLRNKTTVVPSPIVGNINDNFRIFFLLFLEISKINHWNCCSVKELIFSPWTIIKFIFTIFEVIYLNKN